MTNAVLYDVRDRIATITLNRPDRLNAWHPDLHRGYFRSLDAAAADPDVRVIIVTGAGRGFCAGADMDALQGLSGANVESGDGDGGSGGASDGDGDGAGHGDGGGAGHGDGDGDGDGVFGDEPDWKHTHAMTIPKPVIAAINGACAGLGFVHALACDIRFAAAGAKFTVAFGRRGLVAEHGMSWTLPRLVGQAVALDLALSSRVFLAEEAHELGIVNCVFEPDRLIDETVAYARDLADNVSPASMAVMKRQIYTHPSMSVDDALADTNVLMAESLRRADFKEGVSSFVEKRPPNFAPYRPGV